MMMRDLKTARSLRYLPFQNIHGPYTCDHKYLPRASLSAPIKLSPDIYSTYSIETERLRPKFKPGGRPVFDRWRQLYAAGDFTAGEMTMFGYMSEMDAAVGEIMAAFKASGKYLLR